MRLGVSVRVLGKSGLRGYGGLRAADTPHLTVSLAYLRDILGYLEAAGIRMYRMAPDLVPSGTDSEAPFRQIEESLAELEELGRGACQAGIRLSFHAPPSVALGSNDPAIVERSCRTLRVLAGLLDAMGQPAEGVIVVHSGGMAGGEALLIGRWVQAWERLPPQTRRRIVIEHDSESLTLPAALRIHAATGVPVIFDHLHFRLHNPERWSLRAAVEQALDTWPASVVPKTHFATPRTELRAVQTAGEHRGRRRWILSPPRPGHHADYVNPWEFEAFALAVAGLRDFDVLIEAKAGDLALLRLRDDLMRYAPDGWRLLQHAEAHV